MRGRHALAAAASLCAACRGESSPPPPAALGASAVPPGVVARVGGVDITTGTVARIAAAQEIPLARARDAAVRDALLAAGARERGLDDALRGASNAVLARRVLRQLLDDAARAGPVTDEELRAATERHWLELDRPEGFRTVHAVVRLKDGADTATRDRARALAEAIRAAVAGARDIALRTRPPQPAPGRSPTDPAAKAFQQAARAVPAEGFEIIAEPLPPITAAGRALAPEPQQFDPDFSRAAAALAARGDLSLPIPSSYGVHVILLLERLPPSLVPQDERRRLVRDEVVSDRARVAYGELLAGLRGEPALAEGADALLSLVRIEP